MYKNEQKKIYKTVLVKWIKDTDIKDDRYDYTMKNV